jgi:hypothetical protein
MFADYEPHHLTADDSGLKWRIAGAVATLAALCGLLAFVPKHDPTKVAEGVPCSILTEAEIGTALGAKMMLMPTSGAVFRYVATGNTTAPTLFIIARHEPGVPASIAQSGVPVHGVGDVAVRSPNGLFVRFGTRAYTFIVVPETAGDARQFSTELRVAKLLNRHPMIAQNH